jgi:hypothetical protein
MILITFSNNETLEFKTVSQAKDYVLALMLNGIQALGIVGNNTDDLNHLQDYIASIYKSIT